MNKLAGMPDIAYRMNRNFALCELQPTFDDVDSQFFVLFTS